MEKINLPTIPREYSNNGQHAEQVFRFALTGKVCKADNLPATAGADIADIQIKSARATVCHGEDLDAGIARDRATRFAYVSADFATAYIMTRAEYADFCKRFAQPTTESKANGGAKKWRLSKESRALTAYLTERA